MEQPDPSAAPFKEPFLDLESQDVFSNDWLEVDAHAGVDSSALSTLEPVLAPAPEAGRPTLHSAHSDPGPLAAFGLVDCRFEPHPNHPTYGDFGYGNTGATHPSILPEAAPATATAPVARLASNPLPAAAAVTAAAAQQRGGKCRGGSASSQAPPPPAPRQRANASAATPRARAERSETSLRILAPLACRLLAGMGCGNLSEITGKVLAEMLPEAEAEAKANATAAAGPAGPAAAAAAAGGHGSCGQAQPTHGAGSEASVRRRVNDVLNVLEGVGMVKQAQSTYKWLGWIGCVNVPAPDKNEDAGAAARRLLAHAVVELRGQLQEREQALQRLQALAATQAATLRAKSQVGGAEAQGAGRSDAATRPPSVGTSAPRAARRRSGGAPAATGSKQPAAAAAAPPPAEPSRSQLAQLLALQSLLQAQAQAQPPAQPPQPAGALACWPAGAAALQQLGVAAESGAAAPSAVAAAAAAAAASATARLISISGVALQQHPQQHAACQHTSAPAPAAPAGFEPTNPHAAAATNPHAALTQPCASGVAPLGWQHASDSARSSCTVYGLEGAAPAPGGLQPAAATTAAATAAATAALQARAPVPGGVGLPPVEAACADSATAPLDAGGLFLLLPEQQRAFAFQRSHSCPLSVRPPPQPLKRKLEAASSQPQPPPLPSQQQPLVQQQQQWVPQVSEHAEMTWLPLPLQVPPPEQLPALALNQPDAAAAAESQSVPLVAPAGPPTAQWPQGRAASQDGTRGVLDLWQQYTNYEQQQQPYYQQFQQYQQQQERQHWYYQQLQQCAQPPLPPQPPQQQQQQQQHQQAAPPALPFAAPPFAAAPPQSAPPQSAPLTAPWAQLGGWHAAANPGAGATAGFATPSCQPGNAAHTPVPPPPSQQPQQQQQLLPLLHPALLAHLL